MGNPTPLQPASKGHVAVALTLLYTLWGSTYLAIRYAVQSMPPFLMAGVRFVFAGAVLYLFMKARGHKNPTKIHWRSAFIIGFFLLLGGNGGVVWAEQKIPSGLAALLVSVAPLWMAFFDWVRPGGKRPRTLEVMGLVLGFLGLAYLVSNEALSTSVPLTMSLFALFLAPMMWAFGSVYAKQASLPDSPFMATAIEMLAGGLVLVLFGLLVGEGPRVSLSTISTTAWVSFFYLLLFGSLVGFTTYIWLLKHTPLSLAGTYAYVNPLVAVLLGWGFGGEKLSSRTFVAGGIILVSVALISQSKAPVGSEA